MSENLVGVRDLNRNQGTAYTYIGPANTSIRRTGKACDLIFFSVSIRLKLGGRLLRLTIFAGGHTVPNTPDLFRTPKLTVAGPGQY